MIFSHKKLPTSFGPTEELRIETEKGLIVITGNDVVGTYTEKKDKVDTIAVPVSWLKELVDLTKNFDRHESSFIQCRNCPQCFLLGHIDLIREKIK